jgi:hypothetical protein
MTEKAEIEKERKKTEKAEIEKERKKAETERNRQRQRIGHMQGMGLPTCFK